jgi:aspartate kinase
MIIMKFGGTSVKDTAAMHRVAAIIRQHLDKMPVVVVSAMAGITDLLEQSVQVAAEQDSDVVHKIIKEIELRHSKVISEVFDSGTEYDLLHTAVDDEIEKLKALLSATEIIRVESKSLSHAVLSIGEILSSLLLTAILKKNKINAQWVDAREIMITSNQQDTVIPEPAEIRQKAQQKLLPFTEKGQVVVTQGFIGATSDGVPTTLGRNGSDFSASLLGKAIDATEIQIWTDVDGILTADPTIIPSARVLEYMTFDEASELAYFGARVLYPAAIQPAVEHGIPVRVLNSNDPESPGTLILADNQNTNGRVVKSIAYKEGITLLTIKSSQLLLSTDFVADFFQHMSEHNMRVYAVSKSAVKLSLTVEHNDKIYHVLEMFNDRGVIKVEDHKTLVSVVGEKMKRHPDLTWQIIKLLKDAGIHLDLISQFASQISFMFIIDEADIQKTVELLHEEYIENHPDGLPLPDDVDMYKYV